MTKLVSTEIRISGHEGLEGMEGLLPTGDTTVLENHVVFNGGAVFHKRTVNILRHDRGTDPDTFGWFSLITLNGEREPFPTGLPIFREIQVIPASNRQVGIGFNHIYMDELILLIVQDEFGHTFGICAGGINPNAHLAHPVTLGDDPLSKGVINRNGRKVNRIGGPILIYGQITDTCAVVLRPAAHIIREVQTRGVHDQAAQSEDSCNPKEEPGIQIR